MLTALGMAVVKARDKAESLLSSPGLAQKRRDYVSLYSLPVLDDEDDSGAWEFVPYRNSFFSAPSLSSFLCSVSNIPATIVLSPRE